VIATTIDLRVLLIAASLAIVTLVILNWRWRIRVRSIHSWLEEAQHYLQEAESLLPDEGKTEMITLTAYCLGKPGAMKDLRFGQEPVAIYVEGNMFAIIGHASLLLKCEPELASVYRNQYAAVTAGHHLDSRNWNTIRCDGSIPEDELKRMIDHAYDLVVSKEAISIAKVDGS